MPFALAQRAQENFVAPCADPGLTIGRDIGADHDAERSLDRSPAGEGLAVGRGVTARAVARERQVPPPLYLSEILRVEAGPGFVGLRPPARRQAESDEE